MVFFKIDFAFLCHFSSLEKNSLVFILSLFYGSDNFHFWCLYYGCGLFLFDIIGSIVLRASLCLLLLININNIKV